MSTNLKLNIENLKTSKKSLVGLALGDDFTKLCLSKFRRRTPTLCLFKSASNCAEICHICAPFAKYVCHESNAVRQKMLLILFAQTNVDEIHPRGQFNQPVGAKDKICCSVSPTKLRPTLPVHST